MHTYFSYIKDNFVLKVYCFCFYLRPDSLNAGQEEVVMESEGAANLRHNQPENREPPESVHCAHLIMMMIIIITIIMIIMELTFDME